CAVALRFAPEEFLGEDGVTARGEARDLVEMLAELPDLWDVNVSGWEFDSLPSRFGSEGSQRPFVEWVKRCTTKPVVGVGRFTSPDTMVQQIRSGVLDLIGAARPSIADPFLPRKIEQGREDEIRECIGCNLCVSGDLTHTPIRCTQNPTMGEEWRKGWHPERIAPRRAAKRVLVVGAGPAGLEAARALGQRGHEIHLAEAGTELGGRVSREARLPGLAEWGRVRDWRVGRLRTMHDVTIYPANLVTAEDVLEFGASHVVLATGANWRRDGVGRSNGRAITGSDSAHVFTADDLMQGVCPQGPVVLFDDDGYYLGSVLAEWLRRERDEVIYVTPQDVVAAWSAKTLEFVHIQKRLRELEVRLITAHNLSRIETGTVQLRCVYTGRAHNVEAASVVLVTSRLPNDELYLRLIERHAEWADAGIEQLDCIGDCHAPGLIAHAVYAGHRYAREFDEPAAGDVPFRRALPVCDADGERS
ncbi:MAG TPA: FAD-dependent oxidoreductase, partial [Steroidobacteraceae bacterium]|nr:FAD-dependent oxidoreductase [Steroidobacteraceae bacterium]